MAISLAYGVLFATFITLFLVPCSLTIIEDIGTGSRRKWEALRFALQKRSLDQTRSSQNEL